MSQKENSENHISVVGICGSIRPDSYTRMTLKLALEGAREIGVKTKLIDLRRLPPDIL